MPNIDEFFPSKYLKASDLQGHRVEVVITEIKGETVGEDRKGVLYFEGKQKGLVLNRTNSNAIEDAYGPDYSQWSGKPIVLYEARVDFQGRRVAAIRVDVPQKRAMSQRAQVPVQNGDRAPPTTYDVGDDEVPF